MKSYKFTTIYNIYNCIQYLQLFGTLQLYTKRPPVVYYHVWSPMVSCLVVSQGNSSSTDSWWFISSYTVNTSHINTKWHIDIQHQCTFTINTFSTHVTTRNTQVTTPTISLILATFIGAIINKRYIPAVRTSFNINCTVIIL